MASLSRWRCIATIDTVRPTAAFVVLAALASVAILSSAWAAAATTERASVATDNSEADGASEAAWVSADGRFVAFASDAANLVPNDTFGARDIFVRDREAATTERASLGLGAAEADNHSFTPAISGDGRYVAFASMADNLVAGDMNNAMDIFVYDRSSAGVERVSVAGDGAEANQQSVTPSISADGRYVTFTSLANNLVSGDANNDRDVFLHDRVTGSTELISVATDGTQGNFASGGSGAGPGRVSRDGRYVVFGSFANTLVANDTNNLDDIFVRDRTLGTTERVSLGASGQEGNGHSIYGSISDEGRYVAFSSAADNFVSGDTAQPDIFLRDRAAGTTIRVSEAPGGGEAGGGSSFAAVSGDGSTVVFQSDAPDLVAGDGNGSSDIFRYNVATGAIDRLSVASDGAEAHGASTFASISTDGAVTAFQSAAPDLVAGDTLGLVDIFLRLEAVAPPPPATTPATTTPPGGGAPGPNATPSPVVLPEAGRAARDSAHNGLLLFVAGLLGAGLLGGAALGLRARSS